MTDFSFRQIRVLAAALAIPLTAGCQNAIKVRVEKVRNVWSVSRASRVGQSLDEAIESLSRVANECAKAELALDRYIESRPPEEQKDERSFTSGYREALRGTAAKAYKLIEKCEGCFVPPTPEGPNAAVIVPRQTLTEVREFMEQTSRNKQRWKEALSDFEDLEKLVEKIRVGRWKTATEEQKEEAERAKRQFEVLNAADAVLAAAAEAAKITKVGFGGFMSTDVYSINPSDPMYAAILKSPSPMGSFFLAPWYKNTSVEVLTEADVAVTGDSAVMLVMEGAGQIRVYQVRMDPTQITRNIGLLVSKATGAAAKFAAGG